MAMSFGRVQRETIGKLIIKFIQKNEEWAGKTLLDPPESKTFHSVLDIKISWETFEQTQPLKHHKMTVK